MKNSTQSKIAATSIAAVGAGVALMFFFDPSRGKNRRALVHDKAAKFARQGSRSLIKAGRDLSNRTLGVISKSRSSVSRDASSDDVVLSERIRSRLGRLVSYPGAITVSVKDGEATVRGDVAESELDMLLSGIPGVRGVRKVRNELTTHRTTEGVPGLQGSHSDSGSTRALRPWTTPAARLLVGLTGTGLTIYAAQKRGVLARLAETVGLGLLGGEVVSIASAKRSTSHSSTTNSKSATSPQSIEQERLELAAKHEEWK